MKTYTLSFTQNSRKIRTKVQAETEYYARYKLVEKCKGNCVILDCKEYNPFSEGKDIFEFLKGFRK